MDLLTGQPNVWPKLLGFINGHAVVCHPRFEQIMWRSPSGAMCLEYSLLIDRTKRPANALRVGLRGGTRTTATPAPDDRSVLHAPTVAPKTKPAAASPFSPSARELELGARPLRPPQPQRGTSERISAIQVATGGYSRRTTPSDVRAQSRAGSSSTLLSKTYTRCAMGTTAWRFARDFP